MNVATVEVRTPSRDYSVFIGTGVAEQLARTMSASGHRTIVVVSDEQVGGLHGQRLIDALDAPQRAIEQWIVPVGETHKSLWQAEALFDFLASRDVDRQAAIVALGGGVIGDLAGFVASTWLRGVAFYNCPTTLLAAVDASVGGKTGLNHGARKNRIGTFWQPHGVWIDVASLNTLDGRQWRSGLAECVKHACIATPPFQDWLRDQAAAINARDPQTVTELIRRNVETKAAFVARDEQDLSGVRACLNFGHTLGHAIEAAGDYNMTHGECVAVGMVGAMYIATELGRVEQSALAALESLLAEFDLPTRLTEAVDSARIEMALNADKKNRDGSPRFVLADADGGVSSGHAVDPAVVHAALAYLDS